ncbi:phosphoribosyltransferase, partial [Ralstonia pseudosolanacearum]
ADESVCLLTPPSDLFRAVGLYYRDFEQTGDDEVIALLADCRAP